MKKIFNDPRSFLFIFLTAYTIYALNQPSFSRNINQILVAMGTCIFTDFLFLRFYKKISFFPTSGMISSFGIFLMCNSPDIKIYIILSVLTILSKHLLTDNGKHIFNPNNFALTFGVLFLSNQMTIVAGVWGGTIEATLTVIFLGLILIFRANRVNLILSFLISFLLFATVRSYLLNVPLLWVLLPLFGPSFFLFLFYMVSDPKTSPNDTKEQIIFGILLALCDAIFRYNKNKYAPILSLFIMTGFYPFLKYHFTQIMNRNRLEAQNLDVAR